MWLAAARLVLCVGAVLTRFGVGCAVSTGGEQHAGLLGTRLSQYTEMVNKFYNLVTDFYEYGWGESFHFGKKELSVCMRVRLSLASQRALRCCVVWFGVSQVPVSAVRRSSSRCAVTSISWRRAWVCAPAKCAPTSAVVWVVRCAILRASPAPKSLVSTTTITRSK
jgi:hypothetical protein